MGYPDGFNDWFQDNEVDLQFQYLEKYPLPEFDEWEAKDHQDFTEWAFELWQQHQTNDDDMRGDR